MFDDLQELLGIKLNDNQKVALKELARRKNDTLRVYNPLPTDYYVDWGLYDQIEPGGSFLIPGKAHDIGFGPGFSNQPRYITTKFFKEGALLILQSRQRNALDAENQRRLKNSFAKMNRTVDNDEESQFLANNGLMITHDKYLELLPVVIKGIVHEWGLDVKPMQRFSRTLTLDELADITDREVGTEPNLVGVTAYKEEVQVVDLPHTKPAEATTTQEPVMPEQPVHQVSETDPLAGVAA